MAKTADGHSIYVVGQYKPAGNYVGQWGAQVPKPLNGKIEVPTAAELRKYIYLPYLIIFSRTVFYTCNFSSFQSPAHLQVTSKKLSL